MSEEAILFVKVQMKIDALERVLNPEQLAEYRKILKDKRENFIKIWSSHLTEDRLEEALVGFDV